MRVTLASLCFLLLAKCPGLFSAPGHLQTKREQMKMTENESMSPFWSSKLKIAALRIIHIQIVSAFSLLILPHHAFALDFGQIQATYKLDVDNRDIC